MNHCTNPKGHDFRKFDEVSVFCKWCTERRVIASSRPYWYWYAPQYPYFSWTDGGSTTITGTITTSGTVTSGSDD